MEKVINLSKKQDEIIRVAELTFYARKDLTNFDFIITQNCNFEKTKIYQLTNGSESTDVSGDKKGKIEGKVVVADNQSQQAQILSIARIYPFKYLSDDEGMPETLFCCRININLLSLQLIEKKDLFLELFLKILRFTSETLEFDKIILSFTAQNYLLNEDSRYLEAIDYLLKKYCGHEINSFNEIFVDIPMNERRYVFYTPYYYGKYVSDELNLTAKQKEKFVQEAKSLRNNLLLRKRKK